MTTYAKGAIFPSESEAFRDEQTGARVIRLTDHPSINHNLYFLTSSFTRDEGSVIVASYRSGSANYYRIGFPRGDIVQLTDEPNIQGYSGIISPDGSELLYSAGSNLRGVRLDTLETRTLAEYEDAQLGELSISSDHEVLVSAMKRGDHSYITVTRLDGSGGDEIFECPRTIIHPQFHPSDPELIEYAQDPAPRIWTINRDGTENRCLHEHGNDEFIVHETFLGDRGNSLIFVVWPYALKRMDLSNREISTIAEFNAWHIASKAAGDTVLCDTVHPDRGLVLIDVASGDIRPLCFPNSSCSGSQWEKDRYAMAEDWAAAAAAEEKAESLSWMEMKTDTVYGPQWTHPHPSFSPSERWVTYTSDISGHSQVYAVERI